MDRLRAGRSRRIDDGIDREVALGGGGRADAHVMIGERGVEGLGIRIGVDRDRLDAHLAARADDANGNLAAIRYQDSREHA
jgi:hypothetical protein